MRAMGGRPVLMQRFPQGAGGPSFFQKRVPDNAPDWLQTDDGADRRTARRRGRWWRPTSRTSLGGQPRLPRLSRLAPPRRRSRARRRAAPGPRPAARHELREVREAAFELEGAAGRARHGRLSRRRPATAACTSTSGWPRAGTPTTSAPPRWPRRASSSAAARHPHRRVVEGGARAADLRRLQPERAAQDGVRRVVGARPHGRPGLDAGRAGRSSTTIHPDELTLATVPSRLERDGDPWAAIDERRSRSSRCWRCTSATRANGLLDAPWPPVYPKQPDEPPRVAPSRARRQE